MELYITITSMPHIASLLFTASAGIMLCLGCAHLLLTFRGNALRPRDPALVARLQEVAPVISGQTTMWKAWLGFNASHSFGGILFGLVYGDLALAQPAVLFNSAFLLCTGLAMLLGYTWLAWRYWFKAPLHSIALAALLYVAALVASRGRGRLRSHAPTLR